MEGKQKEEAIYALATAYRDFAKKHIGLYPGPEAVMEFSEQLAEYKTSKGTIQLPYDRPLPKQLISDIAKWCYETGNHP